MRLVLTFLKRGTPTTDPHFLTMTSDDDDCAAGMGMRERKVREEERHGACSRSTQAKIRGRASRHRKLFVFLWNHLPHLTS